MQWTNVSMGPVAGSAELWFWNAGAVESPTGWPLPPTLRLGDYNIDGYPDALVTMQNGTDRFSLSLSHPRKGFPPIRYYCNRKTNKYLE